MATVRSTEYPNLWVHDLGVRFVDGVAEVDDPKALTVLAGIDGVEVPDDAKRRTTRKAKVDEPDE